MTLIVCVGVGLAAMRSSTYLWLRTLNTLIVASLFVAILLAWHSVGRRKAFWFGFALFGWGYFFLAFGPWDGWHTLDPVGDSYEEVRPNLLTTDVVRFLVRQVTPFPARDPGSVTLVEQSPEYIEKTYCSAWIGHLLFVVMIAYGGGWLSVLLRDQVAERATTKTAGNQ